MLKTISWENYWIFILMISVGYYIVICSIYYQVEIKDILSGRFNMFPKTKSKKQSFFKNKNQSGLENEGSHEHDLLPVINQFVEEIKYSLNQAAENNLIKQELLYSLQQLAKKYTNIKATSFQSFITHYILVECSNYSSIHLSEEDLDMLWVCR